MPAVEIRIGIEHHLTLVNFDDPFTDAQFEAVVEALSPITSMVKSHPTGVFGARTMMGQYRNVPTIRVVSAYVDQVRGEVVRRLAEAGVPISTKYPEWNPHVSKPLPEWVPGYEVPFATFMDVRWRSRPKIVSIEL